MLPYETKSYFGLLVEQALSTTTYLEDAFYANG